MTTWAADANASSTASALRPRSCPATLPAKPSCTSSVDVLGVDVVGDRGQRLVVDVDQLGRVLGEVAALGDDERDRIADEADLALGERRPRRVGDVPADDRVPGSRTSGLRSSAQNTACTPSSASAGRRVDAEDARPGERAAHEAGVQHPGPHDVVDEGALAGEQALVLDPVHAGPRVARGCGWQGPLVHAERLCSPGPSQGQQLHTLARYWTWTSVKPANPTGRSERRVKRLRLTKARGEATVTTVPSSYASGISGLPLLGRTIGEDLACTVARVPNGEALVEVSTGRRWTYRELAGEVEAVARAMLAAGIGKGDRVGIWSPNCAEWVFVQFASARIGAILVTINPAYRAVELEYVLRQAGIRMLVAAPAFKTSNYATMIEEARPSCPDLEPVVLLDTPSWDEFVSVGTSVPVTDLESREAELAVDDPINIQYTSGTTGFPKGATLSHHNILNNGYFVGHLLGYTEQDRICVPVPFYHCFGMVMGNLGATSNGSTVVIPAPAFDPDATLRAVQQERCTSLYGVPTMFIAELAHPDFASFDLSSLRTGIMAGAPCPIEVMRRVVADMHMDEVTIMYGMTETSPVSTMTRRGDALERRVSTVGTVMPHVEMKIVDPASGRPVPRNVHGEVCTRGYSVMLGYWEAPEQTADAIDSARWMHTGDLGTMDDDGYVAIVGRIKDMVIRGGENVYPREIEEFLYTHPDIDEAQVVGVPDDALRRGADGLGAAAPRRRAAHHRRASRLLPRPAGALQGPAVPPPHRRVPDDGHGQGAKGGDAGAGRRAPPARATGLTAAGSLRPGVRPGLVDEALDLGGAEARDVDAVDGSLGC